MEGVQVETKHPGQKGRRKSLYFALFLLFLLIIGAICGTITYLVVSPRTQAATVMSNTESTAQYISFESISYETTAPTVEETEKSTSVAEVTTTDVQTTTVRRAHVGNPKTSSKKGINDDSAIFLNVKTNTSYSYKLYKDVKTFSEANQTCRDENYSLASTEVRNGEAKRQIVNFVAEIRKTSKGVKPYIWIGLKMHPTSNRTRYSWFDGHVSTANDIKSWGSGQPNGVKEGIIEDCVAISTKVDKEYNKTGLLHDCPCSKKLPFICEILNEVL